ncbi:MAG: hypothetical protein ACOY5C_09520 [Pseudomonadota bacterium]|uniref:hypothetical protein n=1 Tax=Thermithiobacillus tepidarius TaxID=929 RepID=UPI00041768F6|nr:hypothetical protein [Thermithiobacillus tepidarius]
MTYEDIPQEIKDFIVKHINSVEQLEILLLLQGSPAREWSARDVAQELRSDTHSVAARMADLHARGFLHSQETPVPTYRFNPANAQEAQLVAKLASVYAQRRMAVINLIFSKPIDKIRVFADAFNLRKDKSE